MSTGPAAPMWADRVLPADRMHVGVRLGALAVWILSVVVVYLLGRLIITSILGEVRGLSFIALLVGALLLSQPLSRWGERQLIRLWPSGRAVQLDSGGLTLREKSGSARIDFGPKINFWRWQFEIRNRPGGHVPNGHHCMAIRLVQGDTAFSLYAFLPPEQASELSARYPFYQVRRAKEASRSGSLGGRDAVYLAAESARWDSGAELEPEDFSALMDHLGARVPDFAASSAS